MRGFLTALSMSCLLASAGAAQDIAVTSATGGELRVLDKLTGEVTDLSLNTGETWAIGFLQIRLNQCRYPTANPAGDAFVEVQVSYQNQAAFAGWLIASAPALHAMDHPRYDVWALRCMTS